MSVLLETSLPNPLFHRGKVRDNYELSDKLLIVATDRISAFDVVLPCGIPDKGAVLNQLSAFWFAETAHLMPNHLIEVIRDIGQLDAYRHEGYSYPPFLAGRSMVVRKAKRIPVECVVRGYLSVQLGESTLKMAPSMVFLPLRVFKNPSNYHSQYSPPPLRQKAGMTNPSRRMIYFSL